MGAVNLNDNSNNVLIARRILHPDYRARYNDIALFQLAKPIRFSSTILIRPACLMQTNMINSKYLKALGWGQTSQNGNTSDILQVATLYIYDKDSCNRGYQSRHLPKGIINTQLCAGAGGKHDTCQGDSGGPLLFKVREIFDEYTCNDFIVGITSFGIGCGNVQVPGVYTRVSSYLHWIESIVWA